VFVVGHLGDWRPPAAVLFERQSLQGHPAHRREAGEGFAADVAPSLVASGRCVERTGETRVVATIAVNDVVGSMVHQDHGGVDTKSALRGYIQPIAFGWQNSASQGDSVTPTLDKSKVPAVAFAENSRGELRLESGDGCVAGPLTGGGGKPGQGYPAVLQSTAVRRLTPVECERLQGFPDNYTRIAWRNKTPENCPDGHRYKALGNSMAVPVMRWIGERISKVNRIMAEEKAIEIVAGMHVSEEALKKCNMKLMY
jgi:DNA (cytosine-5)-methyltransferase 1